MRDAESVTFGGLGGLDRAAAVRGDAMQLARLGADPLARVLPVWRGKPLIAGEGRDRLGLLAPSHPMLKDQAAAPIFLGLSEGRALFAADVSGWEPSGLDAAAQGAFFDPTEQHHPTVPGDHRFAELRGVMVRLSTLEAELAATARGLLEWHRTHGFCARCGAASDVSFAGWQRTCPACGAHHFPRTDPVVIMLVIRGNQALLGRSPGWPVGMYSCLAGFIEPGETIEAAVRREVFEEAGIRIGTVRYLASQPWPFPASLMIGCAADALDGDITVDPVELEAARWIDREEMVEVMGGRHPEIRPARKGAIAHFLISRWLSDSLD